MNTPTCEAITTHQVHGGVRGVAEPLSLTHPDIHTQTYICIHTQGCLHPHTHTETSLMPIIWNVTHQVDGVVRGVVQAGVAEHQLHVLLYVYMICWDLGLVDDIRLSLDAPVHACNAHEPRQRASKHT